MKEITASDAGYNANISEEDTETGELYQAVENLSNADTTDR